MHKYQLFIPICIRSGMTKLSDKPRGVPVTTFYDKIHNNAREWQAVVIQTARD